MLQRGTVIIEDAEGREGLHGALRGSLWADVVRDLLAAGLTDEEIAGLFRERQVWSAEARLMKAEGYPYGEILYHLSTLRAPWGDVGRALMDVGLSPADMLRVMLPSTDGEDHWPLVQAALLDGPEDADYGEVRGVLEFFFLPEEEILDSLDVDGAQREQVAQRLGLRD
jgi:hypothetical protein